MRRPPSIVVLLLACYVESIAIALWDVVDGLILPPLPGILTIVSVLGAPFFGFLIFAWAFRSPKSWRRWGIVGSAGVLGIVFFALVSGPLSRYGFSRFVQRPDLNAFAAQVHRYERITSMLEGDERPWALNGTRVVLTRGELDSLRRSFDEDAMLLADVLARDSIDPAVYEGYRRALRGFHFTLLRREGDYVHVGRRREFTLVHAAPGAPPPTPDAKPIVGGAAAGDSLGRWY